MMERTGENVGNPMLSSHNIWGKQTPLRFKGGIMDKHQPIHVITISQQCGSDGDRIAAILAHRLQWSLADHEISRQVASLLDMTEEEAALYDERTFHFIEHMLASLRHIPSEMPEAWASQYTLPLFSRKQERIYRQAVSHVIEEMAYAGKRVVFEHGAQISLANRPDVLHIRIAAPLTQRSAFLAKQAGVDAKRTRAFIQHKDQQQKLYFQSQHRCAVDDPQLYDLVLNSATLDAESAVDLICLAINHKERWLDLVAS
jgi:cytidylate kinase